MIISENNVNISFSLPADYLLNLFDCIRHYRNMPECPENDYIKQQLSDIEYELLSCFETETDSY